MAETTRNESQRDSAKSDRFQSTASASSSAPSRPSRQRPEASERLLSNLAFYANYHGHELAHLQQLRRALRENAGKRRLIYLLGDSTMDNKHWLYRTSDKYSSSALHRCPTACNGYERVLSPPQKSIPDVAYWVNKAISMDSSAEVADSGSTNTAEVVSGVEGYCCINAAVEESTLGERWWGLKGHDRFVADSFEEEDVLVFSCGGNDIALCPSFLTVVNILSALVCATHGIGTDPASGYAPGLAHFVNLFGQKTQDFILKVLDGRETRPRLIVVCMLYFLDENAEAPSWASGTLSMLRYNVNPAILQNFIRYVFEEGTKKIAVPGCRVVPLPMFETLDGKTTEDYVARVEPSAVGGKKLGAALWQAIRKELVVQQGMAEGAAEPSRLSSSGTGRRRNQRS
mmetsp:Transcript_23499/g.59475  ORF Transcript_23499/g.59475 Transcript_23499/m.59475 type:complete len:401 (+) Transcript_23499:109-1311(+)|eukprot:g18227.t1